MNGKASYEELRAPRSRQEEPFERYLQIDRNHKQVPIQESAFVRWTARRFTDSCKLWEPGTSH
jgi:hypothetical protein